MFEPDDLPPEDVLSKTQLKKRAQEIHKFAASLVKVQMSTLDKMKLPEEIREEILEARRLKGAVEKNRHIKLAAAMIRDDEVWGSQQALQAYPRLLQGKYRSY